jgi:hypothetical protein
MAQFNEDAYKKTFEALKGKLKAEATPETQRLTAPVAPTAASTGADVSQHGRGSSIGGSRISVLGGDTSGERITGEGPNTGTLKSAGRSFALGAEYTLSGLAQPLEGAADYVSSLFWRGVQGATSLGGLAPNPVSEYAKKAASDVLENDLVGAWRQSIQERYQPTKAEQTVGNVMSTVSSILPSVGLSVVTGNPLVGLSAMGVSAAGSSATEAKKEGASVGQALGYGAASGMLETVIESIAGGIPGFGKGVIGKAVKKVMSSPIASKIIDIAGEGGEEALSTILTPYLKRAFYDQDAPNATKEEIIEDAIMGAVASAILQGGITLPAYIDARRSGNVNVQTDTQATAQQQTAEQQKVAPTTEATTPASPASQQTMQTQQTVQAQPQTTQETAAVPPTTKQTVSEPVVNTQAQDAAVEAETVPQGVGAAEAGFGRAARLVEKYGAIPPGENPATDRIVRVPRQTTDTDRVSRGVRTFMEARATPVDVAQALEDAAVEGKMSYIPLPNSEVVQRAKTTLANKGFQEALRDWTADVRADKASADLTALGLVLYNQAVADGDYKTAVSIAVDVVQTARRSGQAVQAMRILKSLTPQGKVLALERVVQQLNEGLSQRRRPTQVKLNQTLVEEFLQAETDKARDAVLDKIYQDIADQIPPTIMDKFIALRYLNMLGNLKTQGRNILGNIALQPLRIGKDRIGALIEILVDRIDKARGGPGIQRTKSFVYNPQLFAEAAKDYVNVRQEAMGEAKYSSVRSIANAEIEARRRIFRLGVLEAYRKATNYAMEIGDVGFNLFTYADALAGYLNANGVTVEQMRNGTVNQEVLDAGRAYAIKEAQKATYRDHNAFSDAIQNMRFKNADTGVKKAINTMSEGVLPFRRTPANVAVRAVEYSPLGFVKAAYEAKKTGNASFVIDSVASAMTGSMLFALGAYLFSRGMVSGKRDKNDKQAAFDDLTGNQQYALYLPDGTNITLEWVAPAAMPFFMGVEFAKAGLENGYQFKDVWDAMLSISDPLLEMSMLQGVNDAIKSVSYDDRPLPSLALNALANYFIQGATSTLGGQIERSLEGTRMTTYVDKNSPLPEGVQYILGKASAKTPGWDFQQIPYIDAWGRTEQNAGVVENLLSPAYIDKAEKDDVEKELQRLYEATGNSAVLPSRADKSITVDKKTINLTAKQYVAFATTKGQTAYKTISAITDSPQYQALSDSEKTDIIAKAYTYALQIAKAEVSDYEPDKWVKNASEMSDEDRINYIFAHTFNGKATSDRDADNKVVTSAHEKVFAYIDGFNISAKEKTELALKLGYSQKTIDKDAPWNTNPWLK